MPAITPKDRDILARRNTIYIDTESEKSTGEVGGFVPQMGVSMLGLFDYTKWRNLGGLQFATTPGDVAPIINRRPALWVGHNLIRYDLPVMAWAGYLDDLFTTEQKQSFLEKCEAGESNGSLGVRIASMLARRDIEIVDTQEVGQDVLGFRPGLGGFLKPHGLSKLDAGIDAPGMARRGEWGRLATYLAGDVRGGTTVFEVFLGCDQIEFDGRNGLVSKQVPPSWARRRQEILTPPKAVQQGLFG